MTQPPAFHPLDLSNRPRVSRQTIAVIIVACVMGLIALLVVGWWAMQHSGQFVASPDDEFADQHLKTTVALIELHKVRYGQYPDELDDLKFLGTWDAMHVDSCEYVPAADRQSYYVAVSRGWGDEPADVELPEEFWQGTGYDPSLKPDDAE